MRILHTADWHFGRTLEGRSRLEEQAAFVDELVRIVQEEQIDLVLIAGDVYDSVNPPSSAEKLFYECLSRLADGGQRHVAVIAGNHDSPERLTAAAPLATGYGITLLGLPVASPSRFAVPRTGEQVVLYALPYPSESRLGELLSGEADEAVLRAAYSDRIGAILRLASAQFRRDTVNLIMSHLFVLGGAETDSERPIQVGGAYTVDPGALQTGADYVALGHLHRPQTLPGEVPIRYAGSPLAYSFSEAGQAKSVTILDCSPGTKPDLKEIWLTSGRPLVRWKATGGLAEVHRWLEEGRDPRAWIDLEIHLTEALSMDQLQQLRKWHGGIVHIRPVYPADGTDGQQTRGESLPIDELFRRFYIRQTGGAEPEPELVQLFLELLEEAGAADDAANAGKETPA